MINIDLTIGGITDNVRFTEDGIYDYYVGWTSGTASEFAALTDSQIKALATKRRCISYTGQFGSNQIFFLLYKASEAPRNITVKSSGIAMAQDLVNDNTCPHDNVVIDDTTYKVFGIRFYSPVATDSVIVTF